MHGLEELIAGRVTPGVYRWEIEPDELFRTAKKPSGLTRTPEGRLALPLAMGGGHADVEMPPWLRDAEDTGWEVFGIGPARTKEDFLAAAGEILEFPDYYGQNWDAFYDLLTDMDWLPADKGYLVVWPGWKELADADRPAFETALEIFADAADAWSESETPMIVLLPGGDGDGAIKDLERLP
ncbi:barstar family protein [Actinocorallia longicatena]|uniref:Barstar (barnase inhibitor) domain-containing protein n=1 Tax=Actinocorallia longicatena TaxID=111803 RepID=A0ABP6Q9Y9_9ACTN